jgi:thymidylate synthase ThyX
LKTIPTSEKIILPHSSRVYLLAATTVQLPIESFTPKEWQTLNASAVVAGEAGRTCYSKGFLTPKDYLTRSDDHRETTDGVINSTLDSGHLSTRQHVHYLFGLEGVSRNFIYQVLHSFPFHNSDQQSQRYVEMSSNTWVVPHDEFFQPLDELLEGYKKLKIF